MSFWFDLIEISNYTKVDIIKLQKIIESNNGETNITSLRFSNSDTWTLRDPDLAIILHAYLKIKLKEFL